MPVCFSLINRTEGTLAVLSEVDNLMRVAFDEPPDDEKWLYGWYDIIGFSLAIGKTFDDLRVHCQHTKLEKVVDWLQNHYDVESWWETK